MNEVLAGKCGIPIPVDMGQVGKEEIVSLNEKSTALDKLFYKLKLISVKQSKVTQFQMRYYQ
jgi:hypothetical protein